MRGHRRRAACRCGLVDHAAPHRRHRRLPSVHVRIDRRPEGRRRHPRQRGEQRGRDVRSPPRQRHVGAGRLDPALARHGPHRPAAGVLQRGEPRHDVAAGVSEAADQAAQGDQRLPRNHHRRTEFRLRPDRTPGHSRATRRPGPVHLGGRAQRRRARSPPHHRADHERACSGRIHAVDDASRIRHGRGDTDGHRQPRRPAPPRRRRRRPRTEPLHTRQGPRHQPGELRRAGTRRRGANRRPGNPAASWPTTRSARSGCAARASPAATTTVPRRRSNAFTPTRPTASTPTCAPATSGYSTKTSSTSPAASRIC